jgi:hypothetical protein
MYTRFTARGCHEEASRCTCTASSILAWEVNATCPSIPAVLRPALRCVACRTLTSVLLQLRSINFCKFLTVARSCSCAALKIRCRSRRTLSSWWRQSTASHSYVTSKGPFTIRCPTCPSVLADLTASLQRLTCPRQRPFQSPGTRPGIRPVIRGPPLGGAAIAPRFPVGFRPPAFASWTSCSRQRVPLSSRSAYRAAHTGPCARTLSGFPCSARMRHGRGGRLLYSGTAVSSRPAQPLRSAPAASQRPALYPAEPSHRRSC